MDEQKIIGTGTYSKVVKMKTPKGEDIAVKIIKPEDLNFVEIDMLTRIKSPYLVRTLDPIVSRTKYGEGIIMELKEKNLLGFDISNLSGGQLKRMLMTLIYGTECIHKSSFLHLDIKPGNCLYDNKNDLYTCYLSDFGFSMRCQDPYTGIERDTLVGTLKYFPYEILDKSSPYFYNDKSDIWSLGVTILILLKFKINTKIYYKDEEKTSKMRKIKEFWDKTDIPKKIESVVSKLNVSEMDKIDIFQMLEAMLQKDPDKRISSKDFNKLRFYTNNTLENYCKLNEFDEYLYIPYSSSYIFDGIKTLRNYFKTIYTNSKLEIYFLSVEIFIRMIQKKSSDKLEETIKNSFVTAMKYYGLVSMTRREYLNLAKDNIEIVKYLKGNIAPNTVYYKADKIDDLILFDKIILSNYNMISFYLFLDLDKIFDYFQQNYNYSTKSKLDVKDTSTFFDLKIPDKNSDRMIENERDIFSFKDRKIEESKLIKDNKITTVVENELSFRKKIINYLENQKNLEKYEDMFEKVSATKDIYGFYKNYFENIKIYELFLDTIPDLNYFVIEQDQFRKLKTEGNNSNDFIFFISEEGKSSLIRINRKESSAIHYYSNYVEDLDNYFKELKINYSNNYEYGNNFCKIPELCIIFLIHYHSITKSEDFNFIFVCDKTLKIMINFCIFKYDKLKQAIA